MANENEKNTGVVEPKEEPKTGEPKTGEPTAEEPKKEKEFWLVRGAKAAWRGVKKVGSTINTVAHEHPYVVATVTGVIGYGIKTVKDLIGGKSAEATEEETPMLELPAGEDEQEEDLIEFEMPAEEVTEEE